MPDQTRRFLAGQLDETDIVPKIEEALPGATLQVIRQFIENFNSRMDELTKKLLESDAKGYSGIVQEIKNLQTYLKHTLELVSDPNAQNAPALRDLPKIIEKSLSDTADKIRKQILGEQPSAEDRAALNERFGQLLDRLEKERADGQLTDQPKQEPPTQPDPLRDEIKNLTDELREERLERQQKEEEDKRAKQEAKEKRDEEKKRQQEEAERQKGFLATLERFFFGAPRQGGGRSGRRRPSQGSGRRPSRNPRPGIGSARGGVFSSPAIGDYGGGVIRSTLPAAAAAATGIPELALVVKLLEDNTAEIRGIFHGFRTVFTTIEDIGKSVSSTFKSLKDFLNPEGSEHTSFFRKLLSVLGVGAAGTTGGGLLQSIKNAIFGTGTAAATGAVAGRVAGGAAAGAATGAGATAASGGGLLGTLVSGLAAIGGGYALRQSLRGSVERDEQGNPVVSADTGYKTAISAGAIAGAGVGGLVGSIVPGPGNLAGAVVGTGIGALGGLGATALARNIESLAGFRTRAQEILFGKEIAAFGKAKEDWETNRQKGTDKRTYEEFLRDWNSSSPTHQKNERWQQSLDEWKRGRELGTDWRNIAQVRRDFEKFEKGDVESPPPKVAEEKPSVKSVFGAASYDNAQTTPEGGRFSLVTPTEKEREPVVEAEATAPIPPGVPPGLKIGSTLPVPIAQAPAPPSVPPKASVAEDLTRSIRQFATPVAGNAAAIPTPRAEPSAAPTVVTREVTDSSTRTKLDEISRKIDRLFRPGQTEVTSPPSQNQEPVATAPIPPALPAPVQPGRPDQLIQKSDTEDRERPPAQPAAYQTVDPVASKIDQLLGYQKRQTEILEFFFKLANAKKPGGGSGADPFRASPEGREIPTDAQQPTPSRSGGDIVIPSGSKGETKATQVGWFSRSTETKPAAEIPVATAKIPPALILPEPGPTAQRSGSPEPVAYARIPPAGPSPSAAPASPVTPSEAATAAVEVRAAQTQPVAVQVTPAASELPTAASTEVPTTPEPIPTPAPVSSPGFISRGLQAIAQYARDVATGQVAKRGLEQLSGGYQWNPSLTPQQNAVAAVRSPQALEQATNVALSLGPGSIKTPRLPGLPEIKPKFPQYAEHYPETIPGVVTPKQTGLGTFIAKAKTPEAEAFAKERLRISHELEKTGYEPYFNPKERFYVDQTKHPPANADTAMVRPTGQAKLEEYLKVIKTPETKKALVEAFEKGQNLGETHDWYAVGQVEAEYIKEFGEATGRTAFREEFATSMAATTSGNNPQTNFLLSHYLEYTRKQGRPIPQEGSELPVPVGGPRSKMNLRDYRNIVVEGGGYKALGLDQPKMHDFARSYLGDLNRPVIDSQMATGMLSHVGDKGLPDRARHTAYGLLQEPVRELAAEKGMQPGNVQDVSWFGFKNLIGKPMIDIINDSIERTHRLTGMARDEIVRRGLVLKEIPMYGVAAGAGLGAAATVSSSASVPDVQAEQTPEAEAPVVQAEPGQPSLARQTPESADNLLQQSVSVNPPTLTNQPTVPQVTTRSAPEVRAAEIPTGQAPEPVIPKTETPTEPPRPSWLSILVSRGTEFARQHIQDVLAGRVLERGLQQFASPYQWNPALTSQQNAVAMARTPETIDQAMNVALSIERPRFAPQPLGTTSAVQVQIPQILASSSPIAGSAETPKISAGSAPIVAFAKIPPAPTPESPNLPANAATSVEPGQAPIVATAAIPKAVSPKTVRTSAPESEPITVEGGTYPSATVPEVQAAQTPLSEIPELRPGGAVKSRVAEIPSRAAPPPQIPQLQSGSVPTSIPTQIETRPPKQAAPAQPRSSLFGPPPLPPEAFLSDGTRNPLYRRPLFDIAKFKQEVIYPETRETTETARREVTEAKIQQGIVTPAVPVEVQSSQAPAVEPVSIEATAAPGAAPADVIAGAALEPSIPEVKAEQAPEPLATEVAATQVIEPSVPEVRAGQAAEPSPPEIIARGVSGAAGADIEAGVTPQAEPAEIPSRQAPEVSIPEVTSGTAPSTEAPVIVQPGELSTAPTIEPEKPAEIPTPELSSYGGALSPDRVVPVSPQKKEALAQLDDALRRQIGDLHHLPESFFQPQQETPASQTIPAQTLPQVLSGQAPQAQTPVVEPGLAPAAHLPQIQTGIATPPNVPKIVEHYVPQATPPNNLAAIAGLPNLTQLLRGLTRFPSYAAGSSTGSTAAASTGPGFGVSPDYQSAAYRPDSGRAGRAVVIPSWHWQSRSGSEAGSPGYGGGGPSIKIRPVPPEPTAAGASGYAGGGPPVRSPPPRPEPTNYGAPGYGGGGPGISGLSFASQAVAVLRSRGWGDAAIQAALTHGLGEGGFSEPWKKSRGSEQSYGHWQFNMRGGEGPGYLAWAKSKGLDPRSTVAQTQYFAERVEREVPSIHKMGTQEAFAAIEEKFERSALGVEGKIAYAQQQGNFKKAQDIIQGTPDAGAIDVQRRTEKPPALAAADEYLASHYAETSFSWKDQQAAKQYGITPQQYVIEGMDPRLRLAAYETGKKYEAETKQPFSFTSGFRDDYRQSLITSGVHAEPGRSYHGGSEVLGDAWNPMSAYGKGAALDTQPEIATWIGQQGSGTGLSWTGQRIKGDPYHVSFAGSREAQKLGVAWEPQQEQQFNRHFAEAMRPPAPLVEVSAKSTIIPPPAPLDFESKPESVEARQAPVVGQAEAGQNQVRVAPAPQRPYRPDYFVGDSLSVQAWREFNRQGGRAQALATVGMQPYKILSDVKTAIENDPNTFRGKNVVLTSGSNNPAQMAQVAETVRILKAAGANVTLGGVSREHEIISKINPELQALAKSEGIPFAPLPSTSGDRERVHATGRQGEFLANITRANQPATVQAEQGRPPTPVYAATTPVLRTGVLITPTVSSSEPRQAVVETSRTEPTSLVAGGALAVSHKGGDFISGSSSLSHDSQFSSSISLTSNTEVGPKSPPAQSGVPDVLATPSPSEPSRSRFDTPMMTVDSVPEAMEPPLNIESPSMSAKGMETENASLGAVSEQAKFDAEMARDSGKERQVDYKDDGSRRDMLGEHQFKSFTTWDTGLMLHVGEGL